MSQEINKYQPTTEELASTKQDLAVLSINDWVEDSENE
jgi:hypothetical protein